jgi:long-chain acyl-CoA synthetase
VISDAPAEKAAVILAGSGEMVTFGELEDRSRRLAHLLADRGLGEGDHIAVLMDNHLRYLEVCWAAQRSGLFFTPVNWHLSPEEAAYIVSDCGARALVTSPAVLDLAERVVSDLPGVGTRLVTGDAPPGCDFEPYDEVIAATPADPARPEREGSYMFYSSGTTGRPKGVVQRLSGQPFGTGLPLDALLAARFGAGPDTVYLCPAPLYHAAPLGWSMSVQRRGATVVVLERFEPAAALAAIEAHRVTLAQFVPTMFVRMLKLPAEERCRFDLSSLETVVHAAAPCPVDVKQAMLDWWGPIIHEYYAGSEGNGFVAIGPEEWLTHPGSVGRPLLGGVCIADESGAPLPSGVPGVVWFEGGNRFEYHNDPDKTAAAYDAAGRSTLGDIGYLSDDGYLFLTDRAQDLIISGGVNIYPREAEDVLIGHRAVADVAVLGVPHAEWGEEVKAVVEPVPGTAPTPDLAAELLALCQSRLAAYKCPRSVDFVDALPRLPNGKLLKRRLRDTYWAGRSRI